jgi:anaerobic magnesium-protoporphyrin IX monomethyl ester cyclase
MSIKYAVAVTVTLVNVTGRLSTDGARLVSALLKRAGHEVRNVALTRVNPLLYERAELEKLNQVLEGAGAFLLSVYSSYAIRAAQVTDWMHRCFPGVPVFWGGPHCVSVPRLGLAYADGVCFSEADEAIVDLVDRIARGADWSTTPNFAIRADGAVVTNRTLPPFKALDSLPYYDYELPGHWLLDRELVPMSREILKERLATWPLRLPTFYYMTSRGCPHTCTYCNNCRYQALWGPTPIRLQGIERSIAELEHHVHRLGFVEFVALADDDFFARPRDQIAEFAAEYRRRVGLPFGVAFSAKTWRREKLEPLLDAGLTVVQMGVQSGSQRVLDEIYQRKVAVTKTREVVAELSSYTGMLHLSLDFIIDVPWETREDCYRTFRYILDLPPRINVNLFFLACFPGTPLYDRAVAEGIIRSDSQWSGRPSARSRLRYQRNWETVLILAIRLLRLAFRRRSRVLVSSMRMLGSRPVRLLMGLLPGQVFSALARLVQWTQAVAAKRLQLQ